MDPKSNHSLFLSAHNKNIPTAFLVAYASLTANSINFALSN